MLVVHVSLTPLAGSPIRIVRALQRHCGVQARLIDFDPGAYGRRTFPEDLDWRSDQEAARELVARADLLHFHHWFRFGSTANPFGFDFLAARRKDTPWLVQWHSAPDRVAQKAGVDVAQVLKETAPQMVMAQYHARYWPNALPVPLVVPLETSAVPAATSEGPPRVVFTPSRPTAAFAERWETKGAPEVAALLRRLHRRGVLIADIARDLPFAECQQRRAAADLVVDDVVTGSFHTTALEAMAAGKPTLCFVDSHVQRVLAELTGSLELPLVNVHLAAVTPVLRDLCADAALRHELGQQAHDWMRLHYQEADMVAHYRRAYDELLQTGTLRNPRGGSSRATTWLHTAVPDANWAARRPTYDLRRWSANLWRRAAPLRQGVRRLGGGKRP